MNIKFLRSLPYGNYSLKDYCAVPRWANHPGIAQSWVSGRLMSRDASWSTFSRSWREGYFESKNDGELCRTRVVTAPWLVVAEGLGTKGR